MDGFLYSLPNIEAGYRAENNTQQLWESAECDSSSFLEGPSDAYNDPRAANTSNTTGTPAHDFFSNYFTPQLFNSFQYSPGLAGLPPTTSNTPTTPYPIDRTDEIATRALSDGHALPDVSRLAATRSGSLQHSRYYGGGNSDSSSFITTTQEQHQHHPQSLPHQQSQHQQSAWYMQPLPMPIAPSRSNSIDYEQVRQQHQRQQTYLSTSSVASGSGSQSIPFLDYTSPSSFPSAQSASLNGGPGGGNGSSGDGSYNNEDSHMSTSGPSDVTMRYSIEDHFQQQRQQQQGQQPSSQQHHFYPKMPSSLNIDARSASTATTTSNQYSNTLRSPDYHSRSPAHDIVRRSGVLPQIMDSERSSSTGKRKRQETVTSSSASNLGYDNTVNGSTSANSILAIPSSNGEDKKLILPRPEPDECAPEVPDAPHLAFMKSVRRRLPEGASEEVVAIEAEGRWSVLAPVVREHLEEGYNLACQAYGSAMRLYVQSDDCKRYLEYYADFCRKQAWVYVNPYRDYLHSPKTTFLMRSQCPDVGPLPIPNNGSNYIRYFKQEADNSSLPARNGQKQRRSRDYAAPHTGSSIDNSTITEIGEEEGEEEEHYAISPTTPAAGGNGGYAEPGIINHPRRKKPKADANAPVKSFSAYVKFGRERRAQFASSNKTFSEVSKIIGCEWRNIDSSTKEEMMQSAHGAKEKYDAALRQYKTTQNWRDYQKYLRRFREAKAESESAATLAAAAA